MAFFAKWFKNKEEEEEEIKSTGLPRDWHKELLTENVFNYLFRDKNYLTDNNLIKKNIGGLWNNSKLSYEKKLKILYDFIENTYGTVKKRKKKAMMSKAAISLRQAYNAKKKNVGGLINDFTRLKQYEIKHLHRQQDVVDFFNTIARIYEGGVYGSKIGSLSPTKPKGEAPEYVDTKSLEPSWKKEFESKPSRFDPKASEDAKTIYSSRKITRKGKFPPPPTKTRIDHKKAPVRKTSVPGQEGKILTKQLNFPELHEHFRPKGPQGWEKEDDWGKGGRKRRKRKSRKRKSNKRKKRKTRRKYKKKTRKYKKKRRRKSRKRYKK